MQSYKKELEKAIKSFLKGNNEELSQFLINISADKLSTKEQALLSKINMLYFLGNLLDLPTLHSVLSYHNVKSNYYKINFNKLLKNISHKDFIEIFEDIFKQNIKEHLRKMSEKDASIYSRELVTVILDDSIFKQWIKGLLGTDEFFGKFFSGQCHSTAYGFKVVCLGVSIDGSFYPLFLDFAPAKKVDEKGKNVAENACMVASKLVKKWGVFVSECANEGISLPDFHFSCDSGYSQVNLSEVCTQNNLIYISVPKKSHKFTVNDETKKLSEFVKDFEKMEKEYIENCKKNNEKIEPFLWRVKATYESQNRTVVLLFFRLNNSNKVSVIYSTKLDIFQKTLRHHWFNRTYIEQFFKLLKHSMKIQNAITRTKEKFEKKLYQFMFIGFYLQKFVRHIRKTLGIEHHRNIGLEALKRKKVFRAIIDQMLLELLQTKTSISSLLSNI